MQDHELTQDEFGEDLEADSFMFESVEDFSGEVEGPLDEDEEFGIAQTAAMAAAPFGGTSSNGIFPAAAPAVQQGMSPHRKQSGRWVRRGNKIVLLGA